MNRFFVLFFGISLVSCASSNAVSPLFGVKNATVILETNNDMPLEPVKPKTEDKAVVLLNQLFNSDEANKKTVLVINNESDCDFTMMILGGKSYTVPVAAKKNREHRGRPRRICHAFLGLSKSLSGQENAIGKYAGKHQIFGCEKP